MDFILNGIVGRLGILPFEKRLVDTFSGDKVKDSKKIKSLDFNSICCQSDASEVFGTVEKIPVSLLDKSITDLSLKLESAYNQFGKCTNKIVPVLFFNRSLKDVQLQNVISLFTHLNNLGSLVNFEKFDYKICLQNSINKNSCLKTPENKVILYTDSSEPILKTFIDGELSPE